MRTETRRQRYDNKLPYAQWLPYSLCAVSFDSDANIAQTIRACLCMGVRDIHIIGKKLIHRDVMNRSGSTKDYANITYHSNPHIFLKWCYSNNIKPISIELAIGSTSIYGSEYIGTENSVLVMGNETTGVPEEILQNSVEVVHIPMPGAGFCLNVSNAASIALYEASKRYLQGSV